MSLYRFTLTVPAFDVRLAVSAIKDGGLIGSKQMPLVNITDRTAIDTLDPMTIRALDGLVGVDKMLPGVTVAKDIAGTRTVNYDTAALPKRQEIDAAAVAIPAVDDGTKLETKP